MLVWQAFVLGLAQGLTEFLPISSSGHLVLLQHLFGIGGSQILFDTMVHVATLFAVVVFFWKDIVRLKFKDWIVVGVGTVPAVVIGLLFKDQIEALFGNARWVSVELIISGIINFMSDRKLNKGKTEKNEEEPPIEKISWLKALIIGGFQAVAISPGISRSGSTVFGGLHVGLSRETAFKFSFLLSIPAIMGATVLQFSDVPTNELIQLSSPAFIIGGLAAFVSGLLSLLIFKYVIQSAKLEWFAWYCVVIGVGSFIMFSF